MTFTHWLIICASILGIAGACTKKNEPLPSGSPSGQDSKVTDTATETDAANEPVMTGGAYLTCDVTQYQTPTKQVSDAKVSVSCSMEDKTSHKSLTPGSGYSVTLALPGSTGGETSLKTVTATDEYGLYWYADMLAVNLLASGSVIAHIKAPDGMVRQSYTSDVADLAQDAMKDINTALSGPNPASETWYDTTDFSNFVNDTGQIPLCPASLPDPFGCHICTSIHGFCSYADANQNQECTLSRNIASHNTAALSCQ